MLDSGWKVTQYGDNNGFQLEFYVLENSAGNLIVIDGGFAENSQLVRVVAAQHGNMMDA